MTISGLIGAFIISYFVSRLMLVLLKGRSSGLQALIVANIASLILLTAFVGLLKAYMGPFLWTGGLIYIAPQIFWLVTDLLRRPDRVTG